MEHQSTIKIISYNIHSGKNFWMRPTFLSIIDYLRHQQADIISIQEINENKKRGFQFTHLQQALQMDGHIAPNVRIGTGIYGVATFSHLPIIDMKHVLLPSEKEKRGLLDLGIQIADKKIHVLNTHLGLSKKERNDQLNKIVDHLHGFTSPYLLMGDFNSASLSLEKWDCIDTALQKDKANHSTMMFSNQRIDYIYHSPGIEVNDYQVDKVKMSDHYPLIATFKIL